MTVIPQAARQLAAHEIAVSTAIVLCMRNEQPGRVARNLDVMMDDLMKAGCAKHFHVYVLSDTSRPEIAAAECETFAALQRAWEANRSNDHGAVANYIPELGKANPDDFGLAESNARHGHIDHFLSTFDHHFGGHVAQTNFAVFFPHTIGVAGAGDKKQGG